jgi:hypothetical protein
MQSLASGIGLKHCAGKSVAHRGFYHPHMQTEPALLDLARRVQRLVPSHRDPEQFHLDAA